MRYLVLLTESDPSAWERAGDAERQAVLDAHQAFDKEARRRGTIVAGEALAGTEAATTLRTVGDRLQVADGPFAETVEKIGGFYLLDMPDLDAVVAACRLLPNSYTTEIRPVVEIDGHGTDGP